MAAILDLPEIRARVFRWTVAEYEKLEDDLAFRHTELIREIIVNKMSKTALHEFLTDLIAVFLRRTIRPGLLVRQEASLRLADSMPEPDVAVVAGVRGDFRAHKPTTAELVIEGAITSVALDREKALLYAEAGVTEYWIVLGEKKRVEVYRQPVGGIYQDRRTYGHGETIEGVAVTTQAVAVDALFV